MSTISKRIILISAVETTVAAGDEKCFSDYFIGENDCATGPGTSCAGTLNIHYQGNVQTLVPAGTCEAIMIAAMSDTLAHAGSLEALERKIPA